MQLVECGYAGLREYVQGAQQRGALTGVMSPDSYRLHFTGAERRKDCMLQVEVSLYAYAQSSVTS